MVASLPSPGDRVCSSLQRFLAELLVAFGQHLPVVVVILNEFFQLLAETLVEGGVLVEVDGAVLADGVFHLARLGLGAPLRVLLHLRNESRLRAARREVFSDRCPGLIRCSLISAFTFLPASPKVDANSSLYRSFAIGQEIAEARAPDPGRHGLPIRKDEIQAQKELLEEDLEIGPLLDILQAPPGLPELHQYPQRLLRACL